MKYRELGRTGFNVSEISFGSWAIGGSWGEVDDNTSMATLHRAIDRGANFIDTADVYGDGRSEQLIARLKSERPRDTIYVATKAGRRLDPHTAEGYNGINLTAFVERSLTNLRTDAIDLLQLHCPPTDVYYQQEVFTDLDDLTKAGKIRHYGVSVERVEEALKAIAYPNVKTVQIIFNLFRLRPTELFFKLAQEQKIGILARVPLASGLLTGKINKDSRFAANDHRAFNRHGEAFDKGETFSGVPLDVAFAAIEELRPLVPGGATMAQFALRWILMFDAVTCVIPGAKRPDQLDENVAAAELPALPEKTMEAAKSIYDRLIKPLGASALVNFLIAEAGRPGIDRRNACVADRSRAFRPRLSKKRTQWSRRNALDSNSINARATCNTSASTNQSKTALAAAWPERIFLPSAHARPLDFSTPTGEIVRS